jgi:hypothetical protein
MDSAIVPFGIVHRASSEGKLSHQGGEKIGRQKRKETGGKGISEAGRGPNRGY